MYYKIINKECKVFKELKELREKELKIEKENLRLIKDKINLDFEQFIGYQGQQTFSRVTSYFGFKFNEVDKIPEKTWKPCKDNIGCWLPDKRFKNGKEISNFLRYELLVSSYKIPYKILGLEYPHGKFILPYIELCEDVVILYLDDKIEPQDCNVIEITRTEFNLILNKK